MLEIMQKGAKPEGAGVQVTVTGETVPTSLESMLSEFIDWKRLARARRIDDRDVNVLRADKEIIKATIRDYKVVIDVKERKIIHNCADWSRTAVKGGFCKHIAKLFLTLPKDLAFEILSKIRRERDKWHFIHKI